MATQTKIPQKPVRKRTVKKKKSETPAWRWYIRIALIVAIIGFVGWFLFTFREGISYYFGSKFDKKDDKNMVFDVRNIEVMKRHDDMLFGIDVSLYQGPIIWDSLNLMYDEFPIDFVFVRSTMGIDGVDARFDQNYKQARAFHFIRGAYHYYRPNESSVEQAENFIKNTKLEPGDFPPILDIEELPKKQSMDCLKVGLKKWLQIVEKHYKVKPILYSGEHFYKTHLKEDFADYEVWVANYNFFVENIKPEWMMWQFTEKGTVPGIRSKVDVNIFNGSKNDLRQKLIK